MSDLLICLYCFHEKEILTGHPFSSKCHNCNTSHLMVTKHIWLELIGVVGDFSVGDRIRHVHINKWYDVVEILGQSLRLSLVHPTIEREEIIPHHFFISPKRCKWEKVSDEIDPMKMVVMKLRPAALIAVFGDPTTNRYYHFRNGYGEYMTIDSRNDEADEDFWSDTEYHDFNIHSENISLTNTIQNWIHKETEGP